MFQYKKQIGALHTISQEIGPIPIAKNKVKNSTQVNGIQSNDGPNPGYDGGSDSSR